MIRAYEGPQRVYDHQVRIVLFDQGVKVGDILGNANLSLSPFTIINIGEVDNVGVDCFGCNQAM